MIQNKGFFLYFVGATIGRPLDSPKFQAGDQWSPLQKTIHRIGVKKQGQSNGCPCIYAKKERLKTSVRKRNIL